MSALGAAASAGCLGAFAAVLGKSSGLCSEYLEPGWATRGCQAAAYSAMIGTNAIMTALFMRSLRRLPSLQATVVSSAANMTATVGSLGASTVCRAHHSQMGLGHCPSHQWLTPHIQFSSQQQQQPYRHGSNRSRTSRSTAAARWQGKGVMTVVRASVVPADLLCGSSTSRNSSTMLHCRRVVSTRAEAAAGSAEVSSCAVAAAEASLSSSATPAAAVTAPAAEPAVHYDGSSRSSSSGSTGSSSSSNSSSSSVSDSDSLHPLGELGRYSYRMIICYDGTAYSGWQLQTQATTIQGHIERALGTILRENRRVLGVSAAGRTDAGVHARGQVVQFFTNSTSIDPEKLPFKLNSLLPHDIRVQWMSPTAPDFNVTVSAIRKTYHYHLDTGKCHDPLRMRYSHHCKRSIDLDAMRAGAALLIGTHDFTQFSNESKERLKRNPVKTLERLDVVQEGPTAVRLEVQGTGFLYKQVRHMTGALLAVGESRMELQDISRRLEVGNNQAPGAGGLWRGYNVAPAKGLQLYVVEYPAAVDDPSSLLYPDLPHDEFGRLLMRVPGAGSVDEDR